MPAHRKEIVVAVSRPRPVLTSNAVAGAITGLASVLAFLGYAHESTTLSADAQTLTSVVIAAVTLGGHLLAALHAQGKVTPTVAPQAVDGTPLVPAVSAVAVSVPVVPAGPSVADQTAQILHP